MLTRKKIEELEAKNLASYAMKSRDSAGRPQDSKEKEHEFRSRFQRDRDRIVHSNAFRRLEYKTQVFVIHESDYYRTRLTHTMEVSQIARTLARNLRLNEDLTEAIALAHDLGHTPFGHSGEEKLNELMKGHGGFEHNKQRFLGANAGVVLIMILQSHLVCRFLTYEYQLETIPSEALTQINWTLPSPPEHFWHRVAAQSPSRATHL
ncbi:MAG: dNTP triphosphohydrolase, partial [Candidatus Firestonebacteria bacterium]